MPRPSNKIFIIGKDVFVPHPLLTGLWVRTDLSVAKVACLYPGCGSALGVPCRSTSARHESVEPPHYTGSTHYYRRKDAKGKGRDWRHLKIIVMENPQ